VNVVNSIVGTRLVESSIRRRVVEITGADEQVAALLSATRLARKKALTGGKH
jgi:hypothetical protein